jgi:hypothetical protein
MNKHIIINLMTSMILHINLILCKINYISILILN